MKRISTGCILLSSLMGSVSHAKMPQQYVMSLEVAQQLNQKVMQQCAQDAKPAAVVVMDQGGHVLSSQRYEAVGIHNLIAAERKAFTAYSSKTPTLDFMRNAQKNPDAQNLNSLPELLLLGGGVPVFYQGQLIGAVGVAGAGGSVQDHQCAQKGIESLLKQL
ncbi:heme-binding protein [Acinetobacter sp. B51(2017)]|uniref:GlcG/HbpS family heme-binding protein n=1 Tax=Acinetobacter sp. B51(2017) TaxID=2060938 RepID=UPI00207745E2|nr:heme-binding protein [Acinetobacter sp. B51(2017)]